MQPDQAKRWGTIGFMIAIHALSAWALLPQFWIVQAVAVAASVPRSSNTYGFHTGENRSGFPPNPVMNPLRVRMPTHSRAAVAPRRGTR